MSNIQLTCECCNKAFERSSSQHKYQIKKGRRSFCSRSCGTRYYNLQDPNPRSEKPVDISLYSGNRRDEFTGFREFIVRINKRAKTNNKFVCQLTLQDLKDVWGEQEGKCPYTGLALELPNAKKPCKNRLAKASLDRIDSSKGYTKDNVQFMSPYINFMKNDLTQAEFILLLTLIKKQFVEPGEFESPSKQ